MMALVQAALFTLVCIPRVAESAPGAFPHAVAWVPGLASRAKPEGFRGVPGPGCRIGPSCRWGAVCNSQIVVTSVTVRFQ